MATFFSPKYSEIHFSLQSQLFLSFSLFYSISLTILKLGQPKKKLFSEFQNWTFLKMSKNNFEIEVYFQKNLKNNKSKQYKEYTINSTIQLQDSVLHHIVCH